MYIPAVLLLVLALCVAGSGRFRETVARVAHQTQDAPAYQSLVLRGQPLVTPPAPSDAADFPPVWRELLAAALAAGLAAWSLFPTKAGHVGRAISHAAGVAVHPLRVIHSGRIGDYIAWFVFGIAAYGGFLLLSAR